MKREIAVILILALCLTGCGREEDPNRVDTVVWIPVDPTDAPEETTPETEVVPTGTLPFETEEPEETVPEATEAAKQSSGGKKTSSGKNNSSSNNNNSSQKETQPKETQPPATEIPASEPPATESTATAPAATEPAPTEQAAPAPGPTDSTVPEPAPAEPAPTEPPVTEPPASTEPPLYDISGYAVGSLEYAMLAEINARRAEAGLPELALDSYLSAIASCRGYEISQVWSHTRPDGRGYTTVLSDYGYSCGAVTELLIHTTGSGDGASMAALWMNSDSHKGSLLSGSYSTAGIGVYRANGYTFVCCLLVG